MLEPLDRLWLALALLEPDERLCAALERLPELERDAVDDFGLLLEYDFVALLLDELDDLELTALLADLPEVLFELLELLLLCG